MVDADDRRQLRVYLPNVSPFQAKPLFQRMHCTVRFAFDLPILSGQPYMVDAWHVELHGLPPSGKVRAPPELPPPYDEIFQEIFRMQVVTTTYTRNDVPHLDLFQNFMELGMEENEGRVAIYAGQHPSLGRISSRSHGSIALMDPRDLTTIVEVLAAEQVRDFCVTEEVRVWPGF